MMLNRRCSRIPAMLGLAALVILVSVGATPASADHFKPLSPNHTSYGVGQLNYGNVPAFLDLILKLINPVHVTQAAAVLVYESARTDFNPGTPEKYRTCQVRKLTPHASISISQEVLFPGQVDEFPSYAEVIWAPVDKVSPGQGNGQNRRIADGLGGFTYSGRDIPAQTIAHPGLFSLPSNSVVSGQREAAIACVCAGLTAAGLGSDVFSEFGITCP